LFKLLNTHPQRAGYSGDPPFISQGSVGLSNEQYEISAFSTVSQVPFYLDSLFLAQRVGLSVRNNVRMLGRSGHNSVPETPKSSMQILRISG